MIHETIYSGNPKQLSPLTLAFVGDVVFGLLVRERLVSLANAPVRILHKKSVEYVCASAQAKAIQTLLPFLEEDELAIYKRGRNAEVNTHPKNGDIGDYHKATGLETLFGFLYLSGKNIRIQQLFDQVWDTIEAE